jgi:hypothetical protein
MLTDKARSARQTLKALPDRAAAVLRRWRQTRLAFEERWDVQGTEKRDVIERGRTAFLLELSAIMQEFMEADATYRAELRRARYAHPTFGVEEQMAWERLRGFLDALPPNQPRSLAAEQRLKRAQAEGDDAMLRVARRQMPDYLEANGETLPAYIRDWMDIAGGSTSVASAVTAEAEYAKAGQWVRSAIEFARAELRDDERVAVNIPTWEGKVIDLDAADTDYAAARRRGTAEAARILAAAGYRPVAPTTGEPAGEALRRT